MGFIIVGDIGIIAIEGNGDEEDDKEREEKKRRKRSRRHQRRRLVLRAHFCLSRSTTWLHGAPINKAFCLIKCALRHLVLHCGNGNLAVFIEHTQVHFEDFLLLFLFSEAMTTIKTFRMCSHIAYCNNT